MFDELVIMDGTVIPLQPRKQEDSKWTVAESRTTGREDRAYDRGSSEGVQWCVRNRVLNRVALLRVVLVHLDGPMVVKLANLEAVASALIAVHRICLDAYRERGWFEFAWYPTYAPLWNDDLGAVAMFAS